MIRFPIFQITKPEYEHENIFAEGCLCNESLLPMPPRSLSIQVVRENEHRFVWKSPPRTSAIPQNPTKTRSHASHVAYYTLYIVAQEHLLGADFVDCVSSFDVPAVMKFPSVSVDEHEVSLIVLNLHKTVTYHAYVTATNDHGESTRSNYIFLSDTS